MGKLKIQSIKIVLIAFITKINTHFKITIQLEVININNLLTLHQTLTLTILFLLSKII
jgi:hypothetical protein